MIIAVDGPSAAGKGTLAWPRRWAIIFWIRVRFTALSG